MDDQQVFYGYDKAFMEWMINRICCLVFRSKRSKKISRVKRRRRKRRKRERERKRIERRVK
jgi:hypothetical protein